MHLAPLKAALLLGLALTEPVAAAKPKNAILLSEVRSLTLRADKKTTHRRVSAIPQLKCVSPRSVCDLHKVDVMRCTNQGSSYDAEDVQWSCTASLPPELKLGSTEVICEGYAGPDDPYVLRGSCGVEYRLVLTDEGERKYPNLGGGSGGRGFWGGSAGSGGGDGTDWSAWLFLIIFLGVLGWIVYSAFTAAGDNAQPGRRRPRRNFWGGGGGWGPGWGPGGGGGGGGGGFGGGYDDPPPPYPGSKSYGTQGGWQPGFWSGLAGGAAAGYFAGRRNEDRSGYRAGATDRGLGGSSWGAGPSGSRSGSSSSSTSTARYESTGFGSTSRR
ncbi:uncharacterized protein E0L32_005485 [Thyridium curvatum]|uniref:Store-operated calcium entry-associated regulatory factor n=1 Tax=Thyridium curvatum TaxID=1093900 RepID=A0A507BA81_9PEZI|nr:uncharacterized protein E0L32_005485 [Thyridium curvatum]TPX14289.1 hypothetical protein E0L32_005485 [Thyridium curvatum]